MRKNKDALSILLVSVLMLMLVNAMPPVQAPLQGKILTPTADSYVRKEGPDKNWGRSPSLFVWRGGTALETIAYLMFDLAQIPSGANITETTLKLYAIDVTRASISVHYCPSNDWTEEGITYNNKPQFNTEPIDTTNVTSEETWYEWNVTSTVQTAMEKTDKRLSLVLEADAHGAVLFDARYGLYANPPQLDARYWPPTETNNHLPTETIAVAAITIAAAATLIAGYAIRKRRKANQKPAKI